MAASLTVGDLSVRADVSRADMVLACLVTQVGMRISSGSQLANKFVRQFACAGDKRFTRVVVRLRGRKSW